MAHSIIVPTRHDKVEASGVSANGSALVTDTRFFLLNDAKGHLVAAEQLYLLGESRAFALASEIRQTVILAFFAIESFMNQVAQECLREQHLRKTKHLVKYHYNEIVDEKSLINLDDAKKKLSTEEKLKQWTKIITGNSHDFGDYTFANAFRLVNEFRDKVVHHKPEYDAYFYDLENIVIARQAIYVAERSLSGFYRAWNNSQTEWIFRPYTAY